MKAWVNCASCPLPSAITLFAVGEGDRLAADREVAPLGEADVVLGEQDAGQFGVAAEDDAEEVEGFALLEVGGGEEVGDGVDLGALGREHRFDAEALDPVPV